MRDIYTLCTVSANIVPTFTMQLLLDTISHVMEVDTSAAFSFINEDACHALWPVKLLILEKENVTLQA